MEHGSLVLTVNTSERLCLHLSNGEQIWVYVTPKSRLRAKVRVTAPLDVQIVRERMEDE